jgi:hypothetical protein
MGLPVTHQFGQRFQRLWAQMVLDVLDLLFVDLDSVRPYRAVL